MQEAFDSALLPLPTTVLQVARDQKRGIADIGCSLADNGGRESQLAEAGAVGLSPGADRAMHGNEIPIDIELVRTLVGRVMPDYADAPVRRLASSGSTNALFRLGDEFLVRLPRQPGGSAAISKEATWLPILAPTLPVAVPEVVAVFEPDRDYSERWSVVRWIDGEHPEVIEAETSVHPPRENLAKDLAAAQKERDVNNTKLLNDNFVSKAPEPVIAKVRDRLAAAEAEIARISAALDALPAA